MLLTLREGDQDVEVSGGRVFYRWREENQRKGEIRILAPEFATLPESGHQAFLSKSQFFK